MTQIVERSHLYDCAPRFHARHTNRYCNGGQTATVIEKALLKSWKNVIFILLLNWKSVEKCKYSYWKSVFYLLFMLVLEFFEAIGIGADVISHLQTCFEEKRAVKDFIHKRMLEAIRLYLIVDGMPAAVQKYLDTNNLRRVYKDLCSH